MCASTAIILTIIKNTRCARMHRDETNKTTTIKSTVLKSTSGRAVLPFSKIKQIVQFWWKKEYEIFNDLIFLLSVLMYGKT